jgi:hypothetical protein
VQWLWKALQSAPETLIQAAGVQYIFIARDLHRYGVEYDGLAYDFPTQAEPKWVGLDVRLFDQSDMQEPYLGVRLLHARLLEEIVHVWDYRLMAAEPLYASAGDAWRQVECDAAGKPKPFDVPNRKDYDLIAEDWALAVLWYLWRRDELQQCSPERHTFVERLFARYRIS